MIFTEKQKKVTIMEPENNVHDVLICINEQETAGSSVDGVESDTGTAYQYDGNSFRTYKSITESEIEDNLDYYLDYPGDVPPTEDMVVYADRQIDEYTKQLIEEGVI
jgi:hypothetical protein